MLVVLIASLGSHLYSVHKTPDPRVFRLNLFWLTEVVNCLVVRVRGDGREYNFNLYAQRNLGGYSYRQSFKTKKDKWIEVRLPVDKFVATWRGRVFPNEKLDPSKVAGLGILLGDKKPGPFKLEIAWIKASKSPPPTAKSDST